jgi:hypothetical protein
MSHRNAICLPSMAERIAWNRAHQWVEKLVVRARGGAECSHHLLQAEVTDDFDGQPIMGIDHSSATTV